MNLPDVEGLTVAVDTETSGLFTDDGATLAVISVAWRTSGNPGLYNGITGFAFPFDQGRAHEKIGTTQSIFDQIDDPNLDDVQFYQLLEWLAKQRLVFHNAKFDLHHLSNGTRHWQGRDLEPATIWDTMLAQPLLDPLQSVALKATCSRLFGENVAKEAAEVQKALKRQGTGLTKRFDLLDWDVIKPYATQDAVLTLLLFETQQRRLETDDAPLAHLIEREIDLMRVLYKMEKRGIGFDADSTRRNAEILKTKKAEIEATLPFKPTLPAAKGYFYGLKEDGGLGILPSRLGVSGSPTLDSEQVAKMAKQDVPFAKEFALWGEIKSALEKWYDNWPNLVGKDGRLRTSFRQTKVVSGRLSVERVQLQAIPHDYQLQTLGVSGVRSFFKPREGYEIWEMDLSQAEIRVATAIAGCTAMRERLERGEDAHDATTKLVFKLEKSDPRWDQYRSIGKRLTFGMLYGAGVRTTREQIQTHAGVDASESEVRQWVSEYRATFPEFVQAARYADQAVQSRGWVKLTTGRLRHWGFEEQSHKAFNAVIQGGVAETMKIAMIEVEKQIPGVLLLQIHDSMVLEVPADEATEIVTRAKQILTDTFGKQFGIEFRADDKQWRTVD